MPRQTTTKSKRSKPGTTGGGRKKTSPYNQFMKDQLPKFKAAHPGVTHRESFKKVAEMWKDAKENPKNQAAAARA
ncbi:HMG-box domain-containing protein [Streptomyces sp. MZ04]|uniref:HMG-box domain-containing protein n=1 Tax=Streptomyces sp. MZ04 TaxID=2559236 RepID=UPI00107EA22C|nr:HMG-box domain-containing protein [Streptomyces sp. MZ04]TGA99051.1 DUF1014 domain-containing protein [Streptomyces sp. MZ04]